GMRTARRSPPGSGTSPRARTSAGVWPARPRTGPAATATGRWEWGRWRPGSPRSPPAPFGGKQSRGRRDRRRRRLVRLCFVGSARSVHHPARARPFAQRGHTVRLVAVGPIEAGVESEASSEDVIEHVRIEAPRAPSSLGALRAVPRVLSAIRSFAPDILHAHYAGPLAAVAALSGVRPFVVTVMGGDVLFEQHVAPTARQRRAVRRLLARADLILAKSERLARAVGEPGDFPSQTHTVVWGVDVSRFPGLPSRSETRKRWQLEDQHRVVLSPRILQPLYNVHLLVEALPGLLARQPAALLLLTEYVADPDYRRRIEERATALGVRAHVRFLGAVPAEAMPSLYAAADVAASVPFSDGLPQSVFESMAAGTPVVVGALAAYDGVFVDGQTALRVALQPAAIAAAVVSLREHARLSASLSRAG